MQRWGYDCDGVLCVAPTPSNKKWGKMKGHERKAHQAKLLDHYSKARPLLKPPQLQFAVITARKDVPDVRAITEAWLKSKHPKRKPQLYMLDAPRCHRNVVEFKAQIIRRLELTDYVEDNLRVLKGLRNKVSNVRLWYFDGKRLEVFC